MKATFFNYFLVYCLGRKVKIDSKRVRRSLYGFFDYETNYSNFVTKVDVFETKIGLEIIIETHRPEILIGKRGSNFNAMTERIKSDLKRPDIQIKICECKLWVNLY